MYLCKANNKSLLIYVKEALLLFNNYATECYNLGDVGLNYPDIQPGSHADTAMMGNPPRKKSPDESCIVVQSHPPTGHGEQRIVPHPHHSPHLSRPQPHVPQTRNKVQLS